MSTMTLNGTEIDTTDMSVEKIERLKEMAELAVLREKFTLPFNDSRVMDFGLAYNTKSKLKYKETFETVEEMISSEAYKAKHSYYGADQNNKHYRRMGDKFKGAIVTEDDRILVIYNVDGNMNTLSEVTHGAMVTSAPVQIVVLGVDCIYFKNAYCQKGEQLNKLQAQGERDGFKVLVSVL
jgi:hypothetical protein